MSQASLRTLLSTGPWRQRALDRGLDEHAVREGSMPEHSLNYTAELVSDRLPADRPVRALHVGNFVGVSSVTSPGWFVSATQGRWSSIDPNTTHRGIEDPQAHVLALLHHFDLLPTNVIVPGYTLEQTITEGGAQSQADYLGPHREPRSWPVEP